MIGFLWIGHHSPETWVALLTGTLAIATALLAFFTWRMAAVSSAEVAVTVRPLIVDAPSGVFLQERGLSGGSVRFGSGESMPTTIVDRGRLSAMRSTNGVTVDFAIRNAGSGPALLDPDSLKCDVSVEGDAPDPELSISHTVLPLGEPARLTVFWSVEPEPEPEPDGRGGHEMVSTTPAKELWERLTQIVVSVAYADMTGRQRARTDLTVVRDGDVWELSEVILYRHRWLRKDVRFARLSRSPRRT